MQDSQTGKKVLNAMGTLLEDRGGDLVTIGDDIMAQTVGKLTESANAANKDKMKTTLDSLSVTAQSAIEKVTTDARTKEVVGAGLAKTANAAQSAKGPFVLPLTLAVL